jgi:hypothetical protein
MRKSQILGVALLVFALSAVITASASAAFELAQWLVGGALIAAPLPSLTEGEILLRDSKTKIAIVCSFDAIGTIGAASLDTITEVLGLAGELIGNNLGTTPLLCKNEEGCMTVEPNDIEVWPRNLPWDTELELVAGSNPALFFDLVIGNLTTGVGATYEVLCLVLLAEASEECTAAIGTEGEVLNEGGGVLAKNEEVAKPLANCTVGGATSGEVQPINVVTTSTEGAVTASE